MPLLELWGNDARALGTAVWGRDYYDDDDVADGSSATRSVRLWEFMTRNPAAVRDLARLTLPPFVLWQSLEAFRFLLQQSSAASYAMMAASGGAAADPVAVDSIPAALAGAAVLDASAAVPDALLNVASSLLVLGLSYSILVLPAVRVVLCERDDCLADGIRAACRLAAESKTNEQNEQLSPNDAAAESFPEGRQQPYNQQGRVVAVLGLLHVNGVAERLLRFPAGRDRLKSGTTVVAE